LLTCLEIPIFFSWRKEANHALYSVADVRSPQREDFEAAQARLTMDDLAHNLLHILKIKGCLDIGEGTEYGLTVIKAVCQSEGNLTQIDIFQMAA